MTQTNRRFLLAKRPVGAVRRDDFSFERVPAEQPVDGQILVRNLYLSLDPAMRGWMNEGKSYIPPVEIGEVMRAGTVGEVIESKADGIAVGDWVDCEMESDAEQAVMITNIIERDNYVARQSPHNKRQQHIIASNMDQSILLATLK